MSTDDRTDQQRQREAKGHAAAWQEVAGHLEAAARAWEVADDQPDKDDPDSSYGQVLEAHYAAVWNATSWAARGAQPLPAKPPWRSMTFGSQEGPWWDIERAATAAAEQATRDMPRSRTRVVEQDPDDYED